MKTMRQVLSVVLGFLLANASGQEDVVEAPGSGGSLVIEARGLRETPPPLFFSARAEGAVKVGENGWEQRSTVVFKVVQGKAVVFSLRLSGEGEVVDVEGESIRDWAVRSGGDGRFLEVRPVEGAGGEVTATVVSKRVWDSIPAEAGVLTLGAGAAVGFSSLLVVEAERAVDVNIARTEGMIPVGPGGDSKGKWTFQAYRDNSLVLALKRGGAAPAAVEMREVRLEGEVDEARRSVAFVLTGMAVVRPEAGGTIGVLSGFAGASALPVGEAYELRLKKGGDGGVSYELAFPAAGEFPVRLEFRAGLREQDGRYGVDFRAPAGAVVPVEISGLDGGVAFDAKAAVFPTQTDGKWVGFLPSDGRCEAWWTKGRDAGEGKLFFASDAVDEVRVGAGLVRQGTRLELKLLQGTLESVRILLEGSGEILAVEGGNVLGWSMVALDGGGRAIDVQLARAATESEVLIVRSQAPLGEFPLAVEPLRLSPEGAVRHSGHVRVANEGAVRLELSGVVGMTQLAPEQFPAGEMSDGVRQLFVYRYSSAARGYTVNADQVLPEVGVSQILIYEMTESDRVIQGQVELDIREAPLREWTLEVPENYAVVSVTGAEVADYVVGGDVVDGKRGLKVLFGNVVEGRQLVEVRLERNTAAAAGAWALPVLGYPEAKSVRGHVGVSAAPGYRMTPGVMTNLAEVPLAYFPAQVAGLQQTFRLREADWTAEVLVEALEQSIQVDVFHLYSLKEGIAYGSVLLNYFVVGAPVSEWRLEVPEAVGNVAVDGQNVQGWRREAEQLIVTLHQPVLGAATLLLSFEQPMSARGGALRPGEVKPIGVQGERGTIQVVSPSQVKYTTESTSEGLLKIEPLELPAEFRLLTSAPTLVAYQYPGRPA
ncbi:MAG: hypothetical protein P8J87_18975, partial [Verrucomicrobiales bacterium]|nr:hypothetical protein [Verrucomicrobiales bacterium]